MVQKGLSEAFVELVGTLQRVRGYFTNARCTGLLGQLDSFDKWRCVRVGTAK